MMNQVLRTELTHHLILAEQLKASYAEIDEETLRDTLEGISELPDAIAAVVRSALDDEALIEGLKGRLNDLQVRLERFRDRFEKKRELARWAMIEADLEKIMAADLSVSLRKAGEARGHRREPGSTGFLRSPTAEARSQESDGGPEEGRDG